MFREVPVLPVVIPVGVAVLAALLWRLHRRDRLSAPRAGIALALGVYVAGVVANTVFPIFLDMPSNGRSWHSAIDVVPLVDYGVGDAVTNIVVFVPLGVLLPLLMTRPTWRRVLVVVASASLTIEITQFVTANLLGGGHIADVNDLTFNVIGGLLGLGVLEAVWRIPGAPVLIDRFRWTESDQPPQPLE